MFRKIEGLCVFTQTVRAMCGPFAPAHGAPGILLSSASIAAFQDAEACVGYTRPAQMRRIGSDASLEPTIENS
jgi:hypothetical protein